MTFRNAPQARTQAPHPPSGGAPSAGPRVDPPTAVPHVDPSTSRHGGASADRPPHSAHEHESAHPGDVRDFARHLLSTGWTRHPADFAAFLATRTWADDSADTVAVFDPAHVHAFRETPEGTVVWLFDGDLPSVRRAVDGLGPPGRHVRIPAQKT
ncbi:hypothetical protein ACFPM7_12390 [Actinokineospora guangxiensis]|uniref:Uncharacterized protein n=1 Tax=Actinokineospora guangxiensis TaxID=1490288 RepID=A0ABW0EK94_9PSEU